MSPDPRRRSVITCRKCGKENQDHYKFCLGCGNELAKTPPAQVSGPAAAPTPGPTPLPVAPPPVESTEELETARTVLPPPPNVSIGLPETTAAGELTSPASPAAK